MGNEEHGRAVGRMIACLEARLDGPVTLRALADAAGYSPWHASRVFREATGLSPFAYLRGRRLEAAARALRAGGRSVAAVAFDFEFGSHEGFTRAFARRFGMSPKAFRDAGAPRPVVPAKPPQGGFHEARRGDGAMAGKREKMGRKGTTGTADPSRAVFVQVVERPARKAVVKFARSATHYFEYRAEVGCEVWDTLAAVREALHEPAGMWMPPGLRRPGTSEYIQGVEVPADFAGELPPKFDIIDLPPCRVMVFQGPTFEEAKFQEAIGELWGVMDAFDPATYGYAWADEDGPRFQLAPLGHRGYIEARPVRSLPG